MVASLCVAQQGRPGRAPANNSQQGDAPRIADISILVHDQATDKDLEPLAPGDTLRIAVGQEVRLRMTAIPANKNRKTRYPATRFTAVSGERRVRLKGANEEVGRVLVIGNRVDERRPTRIQWEILENWPMSDALRKGYVNVEVLAQQTAAPVQQPDRGVTLFEHENFGGRSVKLTQDLSDLRNSALGNDRASSFRVDAGCEVYFFEDVNFRGRSVRAPEGEHGVMRNASFGNDALSSVRVVCR